MTLHMTCTNEGCHMFGDIVAVVSAEDYGVCDKCELPTEMTTDDILARIHKAPKPQVVPASVVAKIEGLPEEKPWMHKHDDDCPRDHDREAKDEKLFPR